MIKKGQTVSLEYSVFLHQEGTLIDSNVGEAPLVFVMGDKQVFPKLEEAVSPLDVGGKKEVILSPDEAYGPVMKDAFREVDAELVPEHLRKEGAVVGIQDPNGGVYPVRIHKVKGQQVVLDFNHPLAGKSLRMDVKVVHVK